MKKFIKLSIPVLAMLMFTTSINAERKFVHPGCSYTQGQLDRMKAMVQAKVEPYYTTFTNLVNSEHASLTRKVSDRGTQIKEGSFNGTVGIDGRCAHDLALIWHITGDRRYADKAVEYLNANSHYTNTSARGTGPLDNGKINLLIEAAELMRDYEGWAAADQQRFKDMLTYPYYSTTEDLYSKFASTDDSKNGITFYWNIFNGDSGRFGNQGMFGMLAMLAMGVYLDNEIIYDRALRYISGLPHRSDDLPYVSGPPVTSTKPTETTAYQKTYSLNGRKSEIEDYGYDELLQYYFYPNGQCQESSRDQGHVLAGLHKYFEFAEIAWNQGDKFYSLFDNRLLKGAEFNYRYNLSNFLSFPDQPEPWEPAGYTDNWDEVTLNNNMYLQTRCRSGRWESIAPSPDGRGSISNVGSRECAFAHYTVRAGESDEDTKWLRRTREYTMENYGYETSGASPNWFYEWNGWGTLTKTLGTWMAGDPVSYVDGKRVSGIHIMPGEVSAADYDYYNINEDAEGHTYHKGGASRAANSYRPDGAVSLKQSSGKWVVTDTKSGDWMNYTISIPVSDTYDVMVTYRSNAESTLAAAADGSEKVSAKLPKSDNFTEAKVGTISIPSGASVLRLYVDQAADGLEISSIRVAYNSQEEESITLTGILHNRAKEAECDWEIKGTLPTDINLVRSEDEDFNHAVVISSNNTFGHYVDNSIEMTVPAYTYWVTYRSGNQTKVSDAVTIKWGELIDTFEDSEISEWAVMVNNGSGEYSNSAYNVTLSEKGESRMSRAWSFPFHSGNFPILAIRVQRPEGVTMAIYSGTNSWNNGYDTFNGKVGDDIYYYDLATGAFQNNKGATVTAFPTDKAVSVPLQIRMAGPSGATPVSYKWIRTFSNLEELNEFAKNEQAGIETVSATIETGRIYNLMGVDCGEDSTRLPKGIYILNGKKIAIR